METGQSISDVNFDADQLASKYDLPLYVYDAAKIKEKYQSMVSAFDVPKLSINYACKALTNINVLKILNKLGSGLDTVSIQEIRQGLLAGFEPEKIIFTPNCISFEELETAVSLGVKINIDNLNFLEQFGNTYPDYPICVRVNPHLTAGGNSKIMTGHIDSKFGISIHQMPHVHRILSATGSRVEGLHMHTGSDIYDSQIFLAGAEILLREAMAFPDLDYIDFGSGFKVPYKPGDIYTDVADLGIQISERFNRFCTEYGSDVTLAFEPGKYLVSESGSFLVRVNVVKQTTANIFAGVDSGLNHFIRPMFYNAHHEIANLSNPDAKKRIYSVVGYICETDTFASNRMISEIREGDILAFKNAGAYCSMMASNYNSRYRPAEVLLIDGESHLIRKRETFDDIIRNQVILDI